MSKLVNWFGFQPTNKSKICCAYVLTHIDSGKIYVGSTKDLYLRINNHKSELNKNRHFCKELQDLYNKSSKIHLKIYLIKLNSKNNTDDREKAFDIEQELINIYKKDNLLLNTGMDVRIPALGLKHSDESKKKMSDSLKIIKGNIESRKQQSLTFKEMWKNKDLRFRQSNILKERWKNIVYKEEMKKKLKAVWADNNKRQTILNSRNTPEVKAKKSVNMLRNWENVEYRDRMSNYYNNVETKEKQSVAALKMWDKPETRIRQSSFAKLQWENKEYKDKYCKSISIDNIIYDSIKNASEKLNINRTVIWKRLNRQDYQNYFYITK